MELSSYFRALSITCFLSVLPGCNTLGPTSKFYHPLTTQKYPPKPNDYPIPVFDHVPDKKFTVIGRLTFRKSFNEDNAGWNFVDGEDYMTSAVKYNARRVGADAVVMIEHYWNTDHFTIALPGTWSGGIQPPSKNTTQTNADRVRSASPLEYTPGGTRTGSNMTYFSDAQMIIFKSDTTSQTGGLLR